MLKLDEWCDEVEGAAELWPVTVYVARDADLPIGREAIAALVPGHYSSKEHIEGILTKLGKPAAAAYLATKLPPEKRLRSGDLGEILATEFVRAKTAFGVPINRLRWRDTRNMAMRGDDVIGLRIDKEDSQLRFLKVEAKSRENLTDQAMADARAALDKDRGLPSPHSLAFVSEILSERKEFEYSDPIDAALSRGPIAASKVSHLTFSLSGNDPQATHESSLNSYGGTIPQLGVGVWIKIHPQFIEDVYALVTKNALDD